MGKKSDLTVQEKESITRELSKRSRTQEIAKVLRRDHRTIKKYVAASHRGRKKRVQPKFSKLSDRQLRQIHRQVVQTPLASSRQIFDTCDMPKLSCVTRCKALREVALVKTSMRRPPFKQQHKDRRIQWAKRCMETDFSSVIFADACGGTLDGPDGWARGWISFNDSAPVRARRQHRGGAVMFWAAIVGHSTIRPFRVADGLKID